MQVESEPRKFDLLVKMPMAERLYMGSGKEIKRNAGKEKMCRTEL